MALLPVSFVLDMKLKRKTLRFEMQNMDFDAPDVIAMAGSCLRSSREASEEVELSGLSYRQCRRPNTSGGHGLHDDHDSNRVDISPISHISAMNFPMILRSMT